MKRVLYVGLDYHQNSVQVCVMSAEGKMLLNRPCRNDVRAIWEAVEEFDSDEIRAALEACCGSADLAEEISQRRGWSVCLAHPGYVSRMKHTPDKTDWSDARLLADLVRVGYIPRVWLAPEAVRELRRVVHYRQTLVDARRNVKLRIGGLLREQRIASPQKISRWTLGWLEWLATSAPLSPEGRWVMDRYLEEFEDAKRKVAVCEKHLEKIVADDRLVGRLMEQKGIGLITACVMRAEIGQFDRFRNGKQLSHFVGLSPRNASSGERQADAGLIKGCNRMLRAVMVEAAHRLMRYEKKWSDLAGRLRSRGKPVPVVVAAVGNRWLRWLWHQMHEQPQPVSQAA